MRKGRLARGNWKKLSNRAPRDLANGYLRETHLLGAIGTKVPVSELFPRPVDLL